MLLLLLKSFIEFVGTFTFLSVIVNTLSLPSNNFTGPVSVAVALLASIYFGARVTGGHFNPAVSIMMAIKEKITLVETVCYVTSQIAGGVAAAFFDTLVKNNLATLPSTN